MAQVEFQYNGISTIIQCRETQKMDEICKHFISKIKIKEEDINFFYDGKGGAQFNRNLTFSQMANSIDKERKKMNIIVVSIEENDDDKKLVRPKNIICPDCGEDIIIKFENYKINLFGCKNNHERREILLEDFEKIQIIDLKKINCDICKVNNKANSHNNVFYKCGECNKNLCPLCKSKHDKNHNIINYDKINYICNKHIEPYIFYCNKCKVNICTLCEEEHLKHEIELISNMMINKKELLTKLKELKKSINLFNENFDKLIEILNVVKKNINNYYKLAEYMINNYEQKERNYQILYNINEIIYNNNDIINEINKINKTRNIRNKFDNIFNIYNKINTYKFKEDKYTDEIESLNELIKEKEEKLEILDIIFEGLKEKAKTKLKEGNKEKAKKYVEQKIKIENEIKQINKDKADLEMQKKEIEDILKETMPIFKEIHPELDKITDINEFYDALKQQNEIMFDFFKQQNSENEKFLDDFEIISEDDNQ